MGIRYFFPVYYTGKNKIQSLHNSSLQEKLLFPRHVEGVCGFYDKGDHVTIIFRAIYCG